ncbi:centrosomal protein of 63 kDa isoform X1 [Manis pentadactyla]|uniref:centrosomal protein of 63 kDa isoform X1 n=1 Tax=Manis pentadactyla TaxID=143292 RepID=UPI001874C730|nr:centrosomal protein of 63 kDa isoform X1 [Manis pentadactyla]XP_036731339.1 centrosomal protein of 63 kDa isoform X1 [Manis pentadactyla]XP_036731340.1 centrosomal protein of 63 kDa isoform X1 [Manis pentadactyla]XP_036731341.1 centrosomal protein of 63 kDa isoform X1 [Manis pentadactyla]XP_057350008.1 centrosomal protein of 63 kDa isoform X1 [Manis pentadactyla]XP_057350009.1 centrosomal protein of 63 kDa isoform X1 [Manis pentadactyla]
MEALLEGIQNRRRDEEFLTSCEAELQELMKQIDIMVAHKKSEWEGQTHALEACLDIREWELKTLRSQLDMNHKEIGILHQQAEEHEKVKQEMAMEYKQELKKLHEELGRLKRSYEKLQKKHIRDFRGNVKNHREDRSEIERLTGKIEEFRQKSLDWEKQRLIYQQQVSSLEAQRKALAEQSEIIQAQLANRKQKLESVELSSQSEIQHLSHKLERANDTICANELEIERLTMRVNDLVGTNMTVMQEQQQKEEKLRESEKLLEVLQEEKRKLKAALQSQENFQEARMQKKKLQAKLKTTEFQHTVEAIRSLEEPQAERRYTCQAQEESDNVLSHLDLTHNSEELLQAEVTRLESSLESVSATCKQLSQELMEKYEELKKMEVHNNEYRTEIKKLKEQILQAEQSYSSVLEGMKMEISQLTWELHQRDIMIASAESSSSDMEKRLKAEIQKAEEKAVEHKEVLDQMESLKLENRHLSEIVMKLELGLHEAKEVSLADLQENYTEALNKLVSENQQLQKDLMDTKSKLEVSTQTGKENHDRIFRRTHSRAPEFKNTELKPAHGQHRPDGLKTEHCRTGLHSPGEKASDSIEPISRDLSPQSPHTSPDSSTVSLPSNFLCDTHSLSSVLDTNEANFSDTVSESINDQEEFMSSCPLPVSPLGSIAARFLEEEELRSHHILERLDAHIEELKRESEKTVKQFTVLK